MLLALGAGLPAGRAHAQGADELRAELLQTKQELRDAQSLIANLRDEIARLTAELREARGEPTDEPVAQLPADPLACPDSLSAELRRRYERDLAYLPKASPRDGFDRAAQDWCERMHHEIQGRRDWLVALSDVRPAPGSRDFDAVLRVYDEVSLLPFGEAEPVVIPARFVPRVQAEPAARLWRLTVEMSAEPVYNPTRDVRGPFDEPPFIGPYVESGYHIDWVGLTSTTLVPATEGPTAPASAPLPKPPTPGRER